LPLPACKGMLLIACWQFLRKCWGARFIPAQKTGVSGGWVGVRWHALYCGVKCHTLIASSCGVSANNRVSVNDVQERYWFCTAPANLHDTDSAAELLRFANSFAARQPVLLDVSRAGSVRVPGTAEQLRTLETRHNVRTINSAFTRRSQHCGSA